MLSPRCRDGRREPAAGHGPGPPAERLGRRRAASRGRRAGRWPAQRHDRRPGRPSLVRQHRLPPGRRGPAPGRIFTYTAAEGLKVAAEDVWFPNGMVLTSSELVVNESTADRTSVFEVRPDGTLRRDQVRARSRTACAWTPTARSGSRCSRVAGSCTSARAARCWRRSTPAAGSP
ncbi:gluconolactonase [Kutzneria sp. 744]|nr:gluconolactonase [Kutzneria sp. 744]